MQIEKEENSLLPKLRVSIDTAGNVNLTRGSSVSDKTWAQVLDWWFHVSLESTKEVAIVSAADFDIRKNWLRDYWKSEGNDVEVDPSVALRLRQLTAVRTEFEKIAFADEVVLPSGEELSDLNLRRPLTNAQTRNVGALLRMPNGANFSVPGAGKTTTQLVVWQILRHRGIVDRMLVVSPRSAFETWIEEPAEVFEEPPISEVFSSESISCNISILIVNYEQLENPERRERLKRWLTEAKTLLVIDEAHRVKGGGASVRWRACLELRELATRTDLLTGTPLPQELGDLRNLLALSWNSLPGQYLTDARLLQLRRNGVFVRTTKSELKLPPTTTRLVPIEMGALQKQVYSALGRAYAGSLGMTLQDESYFRQRGKAIFTLLAVATNPGLLMSGLREESYLGLTWPPREVSHDSWLRQVVENYANHEIPPKYHWLSRKVDDLARKGRKVLVWSNFVGNLRAMEVLLKPFNPVLIYGAISTDERKERLQRFRYSSDCAVLLSNPQTLGEGVSLHRECHDAVYIDRSYNAGHYLQSIDRIHRLGLSQEQETNIHILTSERTVDERVDGRLGTKIATLAHVMDDQGLVVGSLPSDVEDEALIFGGIDSRDVADLFAHLKDL